MGRDYRRRRSSGNYNQNDGVPGVVYILRNDAFKETWLKIGCSRHSGHVRARDMNREASTGLPAHHECVFEVKTLDCGRAEKNVHNALSQYRKGRQEFFEVDIELAKSTIIFCCDQIDRAINFAEAQTKAARQRVEQQRRREELQKLEKAREAEEARRHVERQVNVDVACPACGIALIAKLASHEIDTKSIRCPTCSNVFSVSKGFQANSDRVARPDGNDIATPYENVDRQPILPPKKTNEWRRFDLGIALIVGILVIGVVVDRAKSHKTTQSHASSAVIPIEQQKSEQNTPVPQLPEQAFRDAAAAVQRVPQPSRSQPTVVPEPRVIADAREVRQAINRAYHSYPYLQSPDGVEAMRSIKSRANFLIEERHVSVADAYAQAVQSIAPRFEPPWYKDVPLGGASPAR